MTVPIRMICLNCQETVFEFIEFIDANGVAICRTCGMPSRLQVRMKPLTESERSELPPEITEEILRLATEYAASGRRGQESERPRLQISSEETD